MVDFDRILPFLAFKIHSYTLNMPGLNSNLDTSCRHFQKDQNTCSIRLVSCKINEIKNSNRKYGIKTAEMVNFH